MAIDLLASQHDGRNPHPHVRETELGGQAWLRGGRTHGHIESRSLRSESNLPYTAHAIDFGKDLVPREAETLEHALFEQTARQTNDDVQDLTSHSVQEPSPLARSDHFIPR